MILDSVFVFLGFCGESGGGFFCYFFYRVVVGLYV